MGSCNPHTLLLSLVESHGLPSMSLFQWRLHSFKMENSLILEVNRLVLDVLNLQLDFNGCLVSRTWGWLRGHVARGTHVTSHVHVLLSVLTGLSCYMAECKHHGVT